MFPNEGDITRWLIMNLEILLYAIKNLQDGLSARHDDLQQMSLVNTSLNMRQNVLMLKAKSKPDKPLSIKEHQAVNHIAYATARSDLMQLSQMGLLKKELRGKEFVFYLIQ